MIDSGQARQFNAALQALQRGDLPQAAGIAQQLAAAHAFRDDESVRLQFADLCMHCELYFEAREIYAEFEMQRTDDVSLHYKSGTAAFKTKHLQDAGRHYARVCELRPEHPAAYLQLGHVRKAERDFAAAARCYHDYIARSVAEKGRGYWSLAELKDFSFADADVAAMRACLKECPAESPDASNINFALAVAAEQRDNFESAHEHLLAANTIQSTLRPFRGAAYQALLDSIGEAGLAGSDVAAADVRPIFIVGLPRSGTTLVEQILAAHSGVVATDELPFIERIGLELERSGGYGQRLQALTDAEKQQYRERYLRESGRYRGTGDKHFIDKNPNNFIHIGLIRTLMPEALIINLRRDLCDNAVSLYRQMFPVGHDYSSSFAGIHAYAAGYLKIMQHWLGLYPAAIHVQSYEALVRNPEEQIAALLDFCQLESEPRCFEFHKSTAAVMTPSATQVSQPMYTSSIDRWKSYSKYFASEFEALKQLQAIS